jgi:uncharacterized protein (TIGR02391 family)
MRSPADRRPRASLMAEAWATRRGDERRIRSRRLRPRNEKRGKGIAGAGAGGAVLCRQCARAQRRHPRVKALTRPADFLPPPADVAELPLDVLAMRLLAYLAAAEDANEPHYVDRHLVTLGGFWLVGKPHDERFIRAITEAWDWLVAHGLLSGPARQHRTEAFVTRQGRRLLADPDGLPRLRAEQRLGVNLHERLADRVRAQYLIGEYEAATFLALRTVEIRVRELAAMPESVVGSSRLMPRAFAHEDGRLGPLADPAQDASERAGTMALFWGAMGLYKNPVSHREVEYTDPTVASEIVLLADLLVRILDGVEARLMADG